MPTNDTSDKREGLCQLCGQDYPVWFAPNHLWNTVMRGGKMGNPDRYNFVCLNCFAFEAEKLGVRPPAWMLTTKDSIATHDAQLLERVLAALPEKLTYNYDQEPSHEMGVHTGHNRAIDQSTEAIKNVFRGKLK